ncbi:MAG TPA: hypothetical protein DCZ95_04995 [Verrucomicrobia bacterium]|nr:hypothetical protein [Verrucomicrobiota bacterium]
MLGAVGKAGRKAGQGRSKKLIELAEWLAEAGRLDCEACKEKYKIGQWDNGPTLEAKKKGPPCGTCVKGKMPDVEPANEAALFLFQRTGGEDGISPQALEANMRIYGIRARDRAETAERVSVMAGKYMQRMRAIREEERINAQSGDGLRNYQSTPRPARKRFINR